MKRASLVAKSRLPDIKSLHFFFYLFFSEGLLQ